MHVCTSKDKSTDSQISGLGGSWGVWRAWEWWLYCSRAVAAEVCLSKCQEWAPESRGQRQRQGIVSPAAGEIHLPHMCTFIFILLVATHWCNRDVRQSVLPLFLWLPCVFYLYGHQCINVYCAWHIAHSLSGIGANLAIGKAKLDWDDLCPIDCQRRSRTWGRRDLRVSQDYLIGW